MKQPKCIISRRREEILRYLKEHEKASVEELSGLCGVSQLTIRRDLDALEELNTISRYFGGAQYLENTGVPTPFEEKEGSNHLEKEVIAAEASKYIENGATVFMNSGTTIQQVLSRITSKDVTVITNNALAYQYCNAINGSIICTGGVYTDLTKAYIGSLAADIIGRTYADACILGVNGISADSGLTTSELQETIITQKMAEQCQGKVIVVADGSKVGRTYSFVSLEIKNVDILITDSSADVAEVERLRRLGLEIIVRDVDKGIA